MATATLLELDAEETNQLATVLADPGEHYEIANGQVVEEPPLGARETWISTQILRSIILFDPPGARGTAVDEMLFVLREEPRLRRRPDLAFVSSERWPVDKPAPSAAAWDVVPDLAVEVVSPTDPAGDVQAKIAEYFGVGVRLVWVVYPDQAEVYVYDSPRVVRILGREDTVDGGSVLPGFAMPLAEVFEAEADEATAAGPAA